MFKLLPEFSEMANRIKKDNLATRAEVESYFLETLKTSSYFTSGGYSKEILQEIKTETKNIASEYYNFANTDGKIGLTKTEVLEGNEKLANSLSYTDDHELMPDTSTTAGSLMWGLMAHFSNQPYKTVKAPTPSDCSSSDRGCP